MKEYLALDGLLKGRSLRQKLVLIVLAATGSALLLSALALLTYESTSYRRMTEADLSSQARLLAQSLAPTLNFDDFKAASLALEAISERPEIEAAAVFGADGKRFASHPPGAEGLPEAPGPWGLVTVGSHTDLFLPIRQGGEVIGTIFLRGHYRLASRLFDYLGILAVAAAAGLGTGLLIYQRLHPSVTTPILAVADAARRVMKEGDYNVRVDTPGDGEVGLLVEAFNGMLDALDREMHERRVAESALREADRRKDEFLATMAHELRNPLAPVLTSLAILRQADDKPEMRARARDMMERQLRQMVRLLDDLLDVSRISRGRLELRLEPVQIATVLQQAVEAVEPIVREKQQVLTVTRPVPEAWVRADVARLTQVIVNLLHNAAKYTPVSGSIEVRIEASADTLTVAVIDGGVGIAPEDQVAIFDMFVQLDRSLSRSQGGLGIGLTIARQIVELHGGRIEVHSPGRGLGSTFRMTVPRMAQKDAPEPAQPPLAVVHAPATGLQVLVADDNEDFADSFAVLLRAEGYVVHVCFDGSSALRVAQAERPDVAFLDIGMPGYNGYELARKLRDEPSTREMRLIAVTGWGQEADRARVMEAGFDHHWVKPIDVSRALEFLGAMGVAGDNDTSKSA